MPRACALPSLMQTCFVLLSIPSLLNTNPSFPWRQQQPARTAAQIDAQDALNRGVAAFKDGRTLEAEQFFRTSQSARSPLPQCSFVSRDYLRIAIYCRSYQYRELGSGPSGHRGIQGSARLGSEQPPGDRWHWLALVSNGSWRALSARPPSGVEALPPKAYSTQPRRS
jgi:hypothetical protein